MLRHAIGLREHLLKIEGHYKVGKSTDVEG
jgi:hypothetical protein